jgi:UDP-N-acetylmuramate: L-alanyl-gamma-D-glutamyl-meso-diaminopimelate ligase
VFEDRYREAFQHADVVIIAGVFNVEDAKTYGDVLDVDRLINSMSSDGKDALTLENADAIVEHLKPVLRDGDVVAVMSNGGFGGIHDKLLDTLRGV